MFWAKFSAVARATMAAALIAAPATVVTAAPAYADCGDPTRALADHPRHRNDRAGRVLVQRQPPQAFRAWQQYLSRPTA